jgi:AraC-like DNA-binding protein
METEDDLEQAAADLCRPARARAGAGFRGRLTMHDLGGDISVTKSRIGPALVSGKPRKDYDYLLFRMHVSGDGWIRQNDSEVGLTSGSGALFAGHESWEQTFRTDVNCVYLQFPRVLLPVSGIELAGLALRPLTGASAGMRLLSGYLDRLHAMVPDMSERQRRDVGDVAVNLLMMALRDVGPATPDAPDAVLLRVMSEYVREHAGDANLTVEDLARHHAVSVRHLYALFSQIDLTPAAFIRRQRLAKARTLLLDIRHDAKAMPTIAAAAGFSELRTFERAFQREYGTTPGRWRRENRA